MKKEFCLRRPMDFKKTFNEGKKFFSPHFALYMRKNLLSRTRLGIAISKSHFKLATRRNKLRRVIKELVKNKLSPHFRNYDIVVASRTNYPPSNITAVIKELRYFIYEVEQTAPRLW